MGIDIPELLILAVLALILFGPEKLPEYAAKLGQFVAKIRMASTEVTKPLQQALHAECGQASDHHEPAVGGAFLPPVRPHPGIGLRFLPPLRSAPGQGQGKDQPGPGVLAPFYISSLLST